MDLGPMNVSGVVISPECPEGTKVIFLHLTHEWGPNPYHPGGWVWFYYVFYYIKLYSFIDKTLTVATLGGC